VRSALVFAGTDGGPEMESITGALLGFGLTPMLFVAVSDSCPSVTITVIVAEAALSGAYHVTLAPD
jgi:hypothetical protein